MGRLTVTVRDLFLLQGSSRLDPLSKSLVPQALGKDLDRQVDCLLRKSFSFLFFGICKRQCVLSNTR